MAAQRFPGSHTTFYRQMAVWLLAISVPLIALLIISCFYSISVSNEKIAESNDRMAAYCAQRIDSNLEMIDQYLLSLAANNPDFSDLAACQGELDAYLSAYAIQNSYEITLGAQPHLSGLFLFSRDNHLFLSRLAEGLYAYAERESIRGYIRALFEAGGNFYGSRWAPHEIDSRNYLLHIVNKDGVYAAALVDFRTILTPDELPTSNEATLVYATQDTFLPLTQRDFIESEQIRLHSFQGAYYFTGARHRYMVLCRPVSRAGLYAFFILSDAGYWDGLSIVQYTLLVLSFLTVLGIPLILHSLRRLLSDPLGDLIATMEQIKQGHLDTQICEDYKTREFEQVKDVFNSMMADIVTLKIKTYEQEIEHQKMEMQYLQLQLRPHFFLNCLKSLFATAQQQKYHQLQEMILSVSGYMRYLFNDNLETVPIESELRFVRDYIQIQQLSSALSPQYEEDVDQSVLGCYIPPFSIEPFVENAVKHETAPGRQLMITVRICCLESDEGKFLDIQVLDNGDGFPVEMLDLLNSPPGSVYNGRHVGLTNLKHRLSRLYGERATTAFYNSGSGSVCEILLPMDMLHKGVTNDERLGG